MPYRAWNSCKMREETIGINKCSERKIQGTESLSPGDSVKKAVTCVTDFLWAYEKCLYQIGWVWNGEMDAGFSCSIDDDRIVIKQWLIRSIW